MFKIACVAAILCFVATLPVSVVNACSCTTELELIRIVNRKLAGDISYLRAEIEMIKNRITEEEGDPATSISCSTTVSNAPNIFVANVTQVQCPENCAGSGTVWGTDIYTHDSRICNAAIHAGLISESDGGVIQVKKLPGQSAYTGSTRNGITTSNYGAWGSSYKFCSTMQC